MNTLFDPMTLFFKVTKPILIPISQLCLVRSPIAMLPQVWFYLQNAPVHWLSFIALYEIALLIIKKHLIRSEDHQDSTCSYYIRT